MKNFLSFRCSSTRALTLAASGLALAVLSFSAHANLNDPPYFNLWSTGETVNGMAGHGTSVELCGVDDTNPNGCNGSGAGWAIFEAVDISPTGTGVIRPFLRFQHDTAQGTNSPVQPYLEPSNGDATAVEGAYNTDSRSGPNGNETVHGLEYENDGIVNQGSDFLNQAHDANQWNHAIRLGDLTLNNGGYDFFLDINEPGKGNEKRTLRLDELKFFVSNSNVLNDYDPYFDNGDGSKGALSGDGGATSIKVWDMDFNKQALNNKGTDDGGVILDNCKGDKACGSGDYELKVSLDASLFDSFSEDSYVYLYNYAGNADSAGDDEAESGFEEWAADITEGSDSDHGVPEPGTVALLGGGLLGFMGWRRRHG